MFRIKSDTREFTIRDEQGEKYFNQCMQLLMDTRTEQLDLDNILCMEVAQGTPGVQKPHESPKMVKLISCMEPEKSESSDAEKPVVTEKNEHFFGGGY